MRNCMKWYLEQSFEVCDFVTFFRVHRQETATTPAVVHDIHPSEPWSFTFKDGHEVFTSAAHTNAPITVVAPAAVGTAFRRWLEGLTATGT